MALSKREYAKNINTELNNQEKISRGLKAALNYYGLNIVSEEIIFNKKDQNKGIDRRLIVEDTDGNQATITGDDKTQGSVQLLMEPRGKQSDKIYLEYKRHYLDQNNKTISYSRGIFSEHKENDILLILTGDNHLILFDMNKFRERWNEKSCNYRNALITDYGFTIDKDNETIEINKIKQDLFKRDNFNEYHYRGYYLRLTFMELIQDKRISDLFDVVDINRNVLIHTSL